jgi:hypothetical protein
MAVSFMLESQRGDCESEGFWQNSDDKMLKPDANFK